MPTRKELISSGADVKPLTREELFLSGADIEPLNVKERVLKNLQGSGGGTGVNLYQANITVANTVESSVYVSMALRDDMSSDYCTGFYVFEESGFDTNTLSDYISHNDVWSETFYVEMGHSVIVTATPSNVALVDIAVTGAATPPILDAEHQIYIITVSGDCSIEIRDKT